MLTLRKALNTAFCLLIFLAASPASASEVEIEGACVTLKDIYGEGYPETSVQCGIKAGERKVLPVQALNTALKRQGLEANAAEAVTVVRPGVVLTENEVKDWLLLMYREEHPDKDIMIEKLRFGREIASLEGEEYEVLADLKKFGSVSATVVIAGRRFNFSYTARVYGEVFTALDKIDAGETLGNRVVKERKELTALRGTPITDTKNFLAKRAIPKGKIITSDMVSERPERVKGDPIRLIYNDGGLKIEVNVVAEGNAVVGKTFPVKNLDTGKTFMVIYRGGGVAEAY